jgi:ABC-type uncharacterized transport system substrate-binding protein
MKSLSRGILALIIVSSILLLSDLQNRNKKKSFVQKPIQIGSEAVAGKKYTLGLCYFSPQASHDELLSGLWKRLGELGFDREKNLKVLESHATGEIGNISPILMNMDNEMLDLVLVTSTPCVTGALNTIKKHPVAFTFCSDPIAAGVGKSYREHVKGISGIGSFPPVEKTIQFILETVPGVKKIGTIYNNAEANSRSAVGLMRKVAQEKHVELIEIPVINSSEVYQATQAILSKGIDAMFITGDNTVTQAFDAVSILCAKNSIPVIVNDSPLIEKGALAAIGPGWNGVGYHSANLVALMLNGASPDTIPLENFSNEEVTINMAKAKVLGLTIPKLYLPVNNPSAEVHKRRFALVHYADSPNSEDCEKGIRKALEDNKLNDEADYTMKVYNAQGDISTLNSIAGTLGNESWDLVFALSTPTAQLFAKKLPEARIVFSNVGDPLAAGLGKSDTDHLSNFCGTSTMSDFEGLIKLIHTLHPGIKRVGTVFTPAEVNSVSYNNRLQAAAKRQGIELVSVPANSATEVLDAANTLVSERIEAFCQISDNLTGSCTAAILKVSHNSKIPFYGFVSGLIGHGAVAVCARDYFQAGYEAGEMGYEVLAGKDPAKIPYQNVKKTDYMINVETAKEFNIHIPDQILSTFPHLKMIKK